MHPNEMNEEIEDNKKEEVRHIRKTQKETSKITISIMQQSMWEEVQIEYLKHSMKRCRCKNNKTHTQKTIEEEIINHNKKHFTMAVQSKWHEEKIYKN